MAPTSACSSRTSRSKRRRRSRSRAASASSDTETGRGEASMSVDELRERNRDKAQAEAERGPARAEPGAAPIGDAIRDFHERDATAFGIPAHRSGQTDVAPDAQA